MSSIATCSRWPFQDPALIDRGLRRTLTSEIRNSGCRVLYLSRFLFNATARPRAWTFITENWTAIEPKVKIFGGDTNLTAALGGFCDASSRDQIQAFFAAHPLPRGSPDARADRGDDQQLHRAAGEADARGHSVAVGEQGID